MRASKEQADSLLMTATGLRISDNDREVLARRIAAALDEMRVYAAHDIATAIKKFAPAEVCSPGRHFHIEPKG